MVFQIILRQLIVGVVGLSPFVLGYLFIPHPLNILVICLFSLRQNMPGETQLHEMATLLRFISTSMPLNDRDAEELANIRKSFVIGNEPVSDDEVKAGAAKIGADMFMGLMQFIVFLLMLGHTALILIGMQFTPA